jgi:hypothetical protein
LINFEKSDLLKSSCFFIPCLSKKNRVSVTNVHNLLFNSGVNNYSCFLLLPINDTIIRVTCQPKLSLQLIQLLIYPMTKHCAC